MNDFIAVVSYPKLKEKDMQWINTYRQENDVYHDFVETHFTLVFPLENFKASELINEIEMQSTGIKSIPFTIQCAIRNNDLTSEYWHVLLVPDNGFSEIYRFHDKLYSGALSEFERLDLDFIPHMGIANSKDPKKSKQMVGEINSMNICIEGVLDKLDIIENKMNVIQTVHQVNLG